MSLNLTEGQLNFLEKELGLQEQDIEQMSKKEWTDVREKCFYIEADELLELPEDKDEETQRCLVATSIADIKYSQLHKNVGHV